MKSRTIGWNVITLTLVIATTAALTLGTAVPQDEEKPKLGFKDTPMLPGGKWHVHDGDRPQPPVVDPGTFRTQEEAGKPPSDAIVLFDGSDTSAWRSRNGDEIGWEIEGEGEDKALVIKPKTGDILSRQEFGDCQLHLEFASPTPPNSRDQGRGNSGLMFFGRYEIQVLDSSPLEASFCTCLTSF